MVINPGNRHGAPSVVKIGEIEDMLRKRRTAETAINWITGCFFSATVALVIIVKLTAAGGGFALDELPIFSIFAPDDCPAAGMFVGEQIEWRELRRFGGRMFMGGFLPGDFDGDGDGELLYMSSKGRGTVYEMDGGTWTIETGIMGHLHDGVGWDIDGDGIDEIITSRDMQGHLLQQGEMDWDDYDDNALAVTPVFDLTGEIVGDFEGRLLGLKNATQGDFDGDGRDDIALFEYLGDRMSCRFQNGAGETLGKCELDRRIDDVATGDFDGDGIDELALHTVVPRKVLIIDPDGTIWSEGTYNSLEEMSGSWKVGTGVDLTGDGVDELVTLNAGIFDVASREFTPWEETPIPMDKPTGPEIAVSGDFNGDGVTEIAVMMGTSYYGHGVKIYTPDGKCIYYEEFGSVCEGMYALESGGRDYLVFTGYKRLFSWP